MLSIMAACHLSSSSYRRNGSSSFSAKLASCKAGLLVEPWGSPSVRRPILGLVWDCSDCPVYCGLFAYCKRLAYCMPGPALGPPGSHTAPGSIPPSFLATEGPPPRLLSSSERCQLAVGLPPPPTVALPVTRPVKSTPLVVYVSLYSLMLVAELLALPT